LNPRPQAIFEQIYMFSGLIWVSPLWTRSHTLSQSPAPYCLAPDQGTRSSASRCVWPYSREFSACAKHPLPSPSACCC